jgi:hypothetical protein
MRHVIEKLLTRATTLLSTSSQRSARKVMGPQSCRNPNFGNFRTPIWESGTKCHLDVGLVKKAQSEPHVGREAIAPSNIRELHKVQRGKEVPPYGGIVLTQNVHVKPLFSKV